MNKFLAKDLSDMGRNPITGCSFGPIGEIDGDWQATIEGPAESPFHGGVFFLTMKIPSDYPFKPPLIDFNTRIFHPNVGTQIVNNHFDINGVPDPDFEPKYSAINLRILDRDWDVTLRIKDILLAIRNALINPESTRLSEDRIKERVELLRKRGIPEDKLKEMAEGLSEDHYQGNSEAAALYETDRKKYEEIAKAWTARYAM